jgi:hypothetical protein
LTQGRCGKLHIASRERNATESVQRSGAELVAFAERGQALA